jgi:hypothetical protein
LRQSGTQEVPDYLEIGSYYESLTSQPTLGTISGNDTVRFLSSGEVTEYLQGTSGYMSERILLLSPAEFPDHLQDYANGARERMIQRMVNSGNFVRSDFDDPRSILIRLPVGSEEIISIRVPIRENLNPFTTRNS